MDVIVLCHIYWETIHDSFRFGVNYFYDAIDFDTVELFFP